MDSFTIKGLSDLRSLKDSVSKLKDEYRYTRSVLNLEAHKNALRAIENAGTLLSIAQQNVFTGIDDLDCFPLMMSKTPEGKDIVQEIRKLENKLTALVMEELPAIEDALKNQLSLAEKDETQWKRNKEEGERMREENAMEIDFNEEEN